MRDVDDRARLLALATAIRDDLETRCPRLPAEHLAAYAVQIALAELHTSDVPPSPRALWVMSKDN